MDTVYKQVAIKLKTEQDATVRGGFQDVARGANVADVATNRLTGSVKSLGTELRATDRGFKMMQTGFYGLASTAGLLDPAVGKVMMMGSALHETTLLVRGSGMALSGLGGRALALATGPLGLATAAIVGIGAAAVSASPRLQDTLGNALNKVTGEAQKAEEAIKRLTERSRELAEARKFGGGPADVEAETERRLRIEGTFRDRQRDALAQAARLQDQARGIGMFREDTTRDPVKQFARLQEEMHRTLTEPSLGRGDIGQQLRKQQQQVIDFLRTDTGIPADALRKRYGAEEELKRVRSERESLQGQLADFERRQEMVRRFEPATAGRRSELEREIASKRAELEERAAYMSGFGFQSGNVQRLRTEISRMEAELKATPIREAQGRLPGGRMPTLAEGATIREQLAAAQKREADAANQLKDAQDAINKGKLEEYKLIKQNVEEAAKQSAQYVRQLEAQQTAMRSQLGLMRPDERKNLLELGTKLRGGGELSAMELEYLGKYSNITGKAVGEYGLRQAEKSDADIKKIFDLYGQKKEAEQAKQVAEFNANLNTKLTVEVQGMADALNANLKEVIVKNMVPLFEAMAKQAVQDAKAAILRDVAQQTQQAGINQRRNQAAQNFTP